MAIPFSERVARAPVDAPTVKAYLYLNAILYLLLAAWCTLRHQDTAAAAGYLSLNASGHSEYLVVYGGLQVGLALFYAYLAMRPQYYALGVLFSVLLYTPTVVYRLTTVAAHWPVSAVTVGTGSLEIVLLAWALYLWKR